MKTEIGELIADSRSHLNLTQDQFGRKYGVSGPAIFKFEKSYVKPSLVLWLQMARDLGVDEKKAVLMWVRAKLPKKYQAFVNLEPAAVQEKPAAYKGKAPKPKKLPSAEELRKAILADRSAPKGLKALLKDDDIWNLYKPKAGEIELRRTTFGTLGDGNKSTFREALRLVREFV